MLNYSLSRRFATLVGSSLSVQLIVFTTFPFIARIYTPDDFGNYAVYLSIYGIVAIFSTLRYELAIPVSESEQEESSIIFISICSSVVFASLACILTSILMQVYNFDVFRNLNLIFVFSGIVINSLFVICTNVGLKHKKIKLLSLLTPLSILLQVLFQFLLSGFKSSGFALVVALCASKVCFIILYLLNDRRFAYSLRLKPVMGATIKKYSKFPGYFIPGCVVNNMCGESMSFILREFSGGVQVLGNYSVAMRLLVNPLSIITQSVSSHFLSELPSLKDIELVNRFLENALLIIFLLLTPSCIFAWKFSYILVPVLIGNKWVFVADFIQVLIPMFFFQSIYSPFSTIFTALQMQRRGFYCQMLIFASQFVAFVTFYTFGSILPSLSSPINFLICILIVLRTVSFNFGFIYSSLPLILVANLAVVFASDLIMRHSHLSDILLVCLAAPLTVLVNACIFQISLKRRFSLSSWNQQ